MRLVLTLLLLPLTAFGTITVTDGGSASTTTGTTTVSISPPSGKSVAAGSTGVLILTTDNAAGNSTNIAAIGTGYSDSVNNVWYTRQETFNASGANAGVDTIILMCPKLTTALTSSDSLTFTFSTSTTNKAWQFWQVNTDTGNLATYIASSGGVQTLTAAPTITTGPSVNFVTASSIGDLIIGAVGAEDGSITIAGVSGWTSPGTLQVSLGSGTTGISLASQYKIVTSMATQTFNPTISGGGTGTADTTTVWIILSEANDKCRRITTTQSAQTQWNWSPSGKVTAGSTAVLAVAADNAGASSANIPTVTSTPANTWTQQTTAIGNPGTALAGVEVAIFTSTLATDLNPTDTINVFFTTSTAAKAAVLWEFTGGPSIVDKASAGTTNTAAPTITTTSIASGDYVVAAGAGEGANTWVDDADSSSGSWMKSANQSQTSGNTTVAITSQWKLTTGAGTQTYNPTLTVNDVALGWVSLHPATVGPTAAQKSAFFMLFP